MIVLAWVDHQGYLGLSGSATIVEPHLLNVWNIGLL
jgi:hypothetical protein